MKPKQFQATIKEIKKIKKDVVLISFASSFLAAHASPGQFVHIKIRSTVLRRPFSIHKIEGSTVFILFRIRGKGTALLCGYKKGERLDFIGPLGKGFDIRGRKGRGDKAILVAGGMGVAPLVFLSQRLKEGGVVLLGAKSKGDVLGAQEFKKQKFAAFIATDDGSRGFHGTVTDLLKDILALRSAPSAVRIYACGPAAMFSALAAAVKGFPDIRCQVSFEQFMGCGLGICCGCVIETKRGYKKVCKDGPVFDLRDISFGPDSCI